jgi:acetyltransferase-like isoleucine patch superfamily enzyme
MPVHQAIDPDNHVELDSAFIENCTGSISVEGNGSRLFIGAPLECRGQMEIRILEGSEVHIEPGCVLRNLKIFAQAGAVIRVGRGVGFNGGTSLLAHECATIDIGMGCLFGSGTTVTISDMHSIIDDASGFRIKPAADVSIGNHVWLGKDVTVLKGSSIGDHSVIGTKSVVSGMLPEHSICVGVPAKAIRNGISWRHDLV